jgi:hypothetical protein
MSKNFCTTTGFVFIAYLLLLSISSTAAELSNHMEKVEELNSSLLWDELSEGFDYSFRFLTFGTYQDVAESTQNPDNDFLKIPRYIAELDVRPDFSLNFRRLELSAKPRMNLEYKVWKDGTLEGNDDWEDDWFINEWLARIRMTENLFASYGRENLQWGPSFLFSPSNPFFTDNGRSNPKQEVPGMNFARLVWLPSMTWTVSFIANLDKGRQEYKVQEFQKVYAMKLDYSGKESYASMILSHRKEDRTRLGIFAGKTVSDAFLLYGEGVLSKGSNALYPVETNNPFGASMEPVEDEDSSLKGSLLVGGSYTLEIGPTLTLEYLHNGFGYNDREASLYYQLRQEASDAYVSTGPLADLSRLTLSRTADPGLSFLRRNYIMLQYQHNEIMDVLNLTFRWIRNLDDGCGRLILIAEYFLGDHVQLFSIGTINGGSRDTEFRTLLDNQWIIGLEYTF